MIKKFILGLILAITLIYPSFADVYFQDGFYVGEFYKELSSGNIYKYLYEDDTTIYVTLFQSGTAVTMEDIDNIDF